MNNTLDINLTALSAKLMSRDSFRETVFARDNHACVICGAAARDAHHIIERKLWTDGGYYLDNGASLCGEHHIQAETTELSCETIRGAAGITKVILPESYYRDHIYTKWGDVVLPNGLRMKGPLFSDGSVQKILRAGPNYGLYTDYVKYPRSYHLPWSEGRTSDDKTLPNTRHFEGQRVIISEKMDGENTTIYKDYVHARSIDGRDHWSRSWVKNLQAKIGYEIPDGWRICGENLYAKHSIKYDDLRSYFMVFSIWNEKNECISWDETVQYADILGLQTVPVIYDGLWDEKLVQSIYPKMDRNRQEGYVVRVADAFPYLSFYRSLAKFVRQEHVGTSHHWMFTASEKNTIKE